MEIFDSYNLYCQGGWLEGLNLETHYFTWGKKIGYFEFLSKEEGH